MSGCVQARAEVTVEPGPASQSLRWHCAAPVVLRPTGPDRVHLVQAAGGPLGGDELALDVHLGAGTYLRVRSAAATIVQAGRSPAAAAWTVAATLGHRAMLDWRPEPIVICDGAELRSSMTVTLQRGARAMLREVVVLGRAGQRGGHFHGELIVEHDGVPLLAHTLLLDGADPALSGPAGTGGVRVAGMLTVVGEGTAGPPQDAGEEPGLRWACSALDGPGHLLLALGERPAVVSALLDNAAAQVCAGACGPALASPSSTSGPSSARRTALASNSATPERASPTAAEPECWPTRWCAGGCRRGR